MKLLRAALVILAVMASPRLARANAAPMIFLGARHGPIAPRSSTNIHVVREELSFDVPDDLSPANVTAKYTMRADARERVTIAFAFVRAGFSSPGGSLRIDTSITIDGTPIDAELTTDGALIEPRLRAWLDARPDVTRALRAASDAGEQSDEAKRIMESLGAPCGEGCPALLRWWSGRDHGQAPWDIGYWLALRAAREVIPNEVEALQRGWSTFEEARHLGFLLFHADMDRDRPREITVRYEHYPMRDSRDYVNGVYLFEYLLSPASRWASFGPLDVTIRVPAHAELSSSRAFTRDPSTGALRASFATLPPGELTFTVTSTKGLWLGLARHRSYWILLGAAIATAATLVSALAGLLAARRRAGQRVLLAAVAGAAFAFVAAFATHAALVGALPRHALYFDTYYEDDRPSSGWMIPVAGLSGGVFAMIACVVRSRRARRAGL